MIRIHHKRIDTLVPWKYGEKEIASLEDMPEKTIGFIYEIEFSDGLKYIGKKSVFSNRRVKITTTQRKYPEYEFVLVKDKKTNKYKKMERIKIESRWKEYKGSAIACKDKKPIRRTILEFCSNDNEMTYLEARHLFINDVLRRDDYINENIDGRYFAKWILKDEVAQNKGNRRGDSNQICLISQ